MHAVTICARNYLSRARVLARSYTAHNPDDGFTIFLVDAQPDEIQPEAGYHIACPQMLKIDPDEFQRMAMIYDITELSTALKPWVLEALLDAGEQTIMYLDPDIEVFDSLREINELAAQHGIVLTPHTTKPVPRDGLRPTEADLMGAGTFNLGFIALNASNRPFLEWWQERLKRDSLFAPHLMVFVDQRWIDLVPGYFPHTILTRPGYNVAYWNLDNRRVESADGKFLVDGEPLYFFHYSGYDPAKPWVLSKYVADNPRVVLSEHSAVRTICDNYRSQLLETDEAAGGLASYRFNTLPTGERITPQIRTVYRNALAEAETRGTEMPPPPFEADSSAPAEWLREPVQAYSPVNRYLYAIWESRPDLGQAFPYPMSSSGPELVNWAWLNAEVGAGIVQELLPARKAPPRTRVIVSDRPGVNVAGYFLAELGVGQMGRLVVDAVKASELPYSTLVNRQTPSRQKARFEEVASPIRYPINISAVNADQFPTWAHEVGQEFFDGRRTVGVWAWELEEFPDYPVSVGLVSEIWTLSKFCQSAIGRTTDKPVHVIPLPITEPPPHHPLDREQLGMPEGHYFLFCFDFFSIFERKNPLGLVEAFRSAFPEGSGPILVIKSVNGDKCRVDRDRLRLACVDRRDIILLESYLSEDELSSLMGEATAYVSLHRSEGFGLTMAEAMARARPVIATGYSGNLDFMDSSNSRLIPFELMPVAEGTGTYSAKTRWAEPSVEAAAAAMRWVVENPEEAASMGQRARRSILSTHGLAKTARFVGDRVANLMESIEPSNDAETQSTHAPAHTVVNSDEQSENTPANNSLAFPPAEEIVAAMQTARNRINGSANLASPSRAPRLAPRVRKTVYRTLSHHDEFAKSQLESLIDAIELVRSEQQGINHRLESRLAQLDQHQTQTNNGLSVLQDDVTHARTGFARLRSLSGDLRESIADLARQTHGVTFEALSKVTTQTEQVARAVEGLDGRIDEVAMTVAGADAVAAAAGAHLTALDVHLQALTAEMGSATTALRSGVARLDFEQQARPFTATPDAVTLTGEDGEKYFGFDGSVSLGEKSSYATFEDVFRGSEEFISARMEPYLSIIGDQAPVLDVGCGRGEFLQLLRTNGISASGVDIDPSMVERARGHGLTVDLTDAETALRARPAGSLGAVTSFQVVEHISPEQMRHLFEASFDALAPGGLLIAETVNPHSPAALKTFWLDLTHIRPLFPESLLFLARECGFASARIFFPSGSGDLDTDLRNCGEYALIAVKAR